MALPCQILVSVDGCRSLTAFGGCAHWARASSRRPLPHTAPIGRGAARGKAGWLRVTAARRRASRLAGRGSTPAPHTAPIERGTARGKVGWLRVTAVARQVPRLAGLVRFPAGWRVQAAIRQRASWLAYPSNCFGTSGNIIKQGMFSNPSESIPCFFIFGLVFENNSDCSASRGTLRATAVYNLQGSLPDRRAARPVAERR